MKSPVIKNMPSTSSDPQLGLAVLKVFFAERSLLGPLRVMAERVGHFFQVPLPGFKPYIVFGPETVRKVLITDRHKFLWRNRDPVADLLRRGVLITDGREHDFARALMEPSLHPRVLPAYTDMMIRQADRVTAQWRDGDTIDMLIEGRKIALLIIMDALFSVDAWDDLPRIWTPILKAIDYISPGMWILWRRIPRPGFRKPLKALNDYLYGIINTRRWAMHNGPRSTVNGPSSSVHRPDLLQHLIDAGLDDDCIRDQMLTMLIAGHDTSTALLAWTFALLGQHPDIFAQLITELDSTSPNLAPRLLNNVIKEALRLYPPIHIGNRIVAEEANFGEGQTMPAGARMFYSIYLTHRDPRVWENADAFHPERFTHSRNTPPMSYIPFGGGPRTCIGAAFGQAEARLVLAHLLQTWAFEPISADKIHPHMGATLEPRPGVFMKVTRRNSRAENSD